MRNLINCIRFTNKYTKIVSPIVDKRINEYFSYTNRIMKSSAKSNAIEALKLTKFETAVSSILLLCPNVNAELAAEALVAFQAIIQYLNTICEHSSVSTEPFLNVIFSSLKDALNIRTEDFEKYFTFFPSKDDDGYLSILVEKCRQKVQQLPAFDIIRDSLVAALALFIDLQITKYSSEDNGKEVNLLNWSSAHGQKYTSISNWEFCMAIDSTLNIQLLLALATNPELTEQDAEKLSSAFFPWICGIQKILEGYLNYNDDLSTGSLNYLFYYSNLKEYEDRIIYFINKATATEARNTGYYKSVLKILLSLYITHPKADEGMNKITSKALFRAGGRGMFLYNGSVKLIRALKFL